MGIPEWRQRAEAVKQWRSIRVRVYHDFYGCETGCCGHVVEIQDGRYGSKDTRDSFDFTHCYEKGQKEQREWARELAEAQIKYRWPECLPHIDWDTLEIEVSDD